MKEDLELCQLAEALFDSEEPLSSEEMEEAIQNLFPEIVARFKFLVLSY